MLLQKVKKFAFFVTKLIFFVTKPFFFLFINFYLSYQQKEKWCKVRKRWILFYNYNLFQKSDDYKLDYNLEVG